MNVEDGRRRVRRDTEDALMLAGRRGKGEQRRDRRKNESRGGRGVKSENMISVREGGNSATYQVRVKLHHHEGEEEC